MKCFNTLSIHAALILATPAMLSAISQEEFDFIMDANEASRMALSHAEYRYAEETVQSDGKGGMDRISREGRMVFQDKDFRGELLYNLDRSVAPINNMTVYVSMNEDYFYYREDEMNLSRQIFHSATYTLIPESLGVISTYVPAFHMAPFQSVEGMDLRDSLESLPLAKLEKSENSSSLELTLHHEGINILKVVFDKENGYLMNHYSNRDMKGNLVNHLDIEIGKVNGISYPMAVTHRIWNASRAFDEENPMVSHTATLKEINIGINYPESYFTLEGLDYFGLYADETLFRIKPDGEATTLKRNNGECHKRDVQQ